MFRILLRYIRYLFISGHRKGHGIHSPFVYAFVRNVLRNDTGIDDPHKIIYWHKNLRKNRESLAVDKIGERSHASSADVREISKLVRNSSISVKYGKLLYRLVHYFKPEKIVELGTGLGISTAYLAAANKVAEILTIEGSTSKIEFAESELTKLGLTNISFFSNRFEDVLSDLKVDRARSLIFIDGNHNYKSTMRYFNHFKKQMGTESIIIFDDIHWSEEMVKAWKDICKDKSIGLSINLFFFGIVFFRKTREKHHFNIKF
jgi:predicted O-methyltransferase YrrM